MRTKVQEAYCRNRQASTAPHQSQGFSIGLDIQFVSNSISNCSYILTVVPER